MQFLKTKYLLSSGLAIVFCILALLLLNFKRTNPHFLKEKGFTRHLKTAYVDLVSKQQLPPDTYSLLGIFEGSVFVRGYNTASILRIAPFDTTVLPDSRSTNAAYKLPQAEAGSVELNAASGELAVFSPEAKRLTVLDAHNFKEKYQVLLNAGFTRASKAGRYVLTTTDSAYRALFKLYRLSPAHTAQAIKTLDLLRGTSMSEDGILKSNGVNLFAFVSFYKNSLWVIDTMARVRAGHTIDTITTGPKTALIMNDSRMVYAEPVRLTNSNFHFMDGLLAIESMVASDTPYEHLKENNLVDFYTTQGRYVYSLALSGEYKVRPRDVLVQAGLLYVLSGNKLLTYKLKLSK
jgi:hypothetical protein